MCVICQSGPQILVGVPAAGLIVSRIRQALVRSRDGEPAGDDAPQERDGGTA